MHFCNVEDTKQHFFLRRRGETMHSTQYLLFKLNTFLVLKGTFPLWPNSTKITHAEEDRDLEAGHSVGLRRPFTDQENSNHSLIVK